MWALSVLRVLSSFSFLIITTPYELSALVTTYFTDKKIEDQKKLRHYVKLYGLLVAEL